MTEQINYRYTVDELADHLRDYLDQVAGELAEEMEKGAGGEPGLAERLRGYKDAVEDIQRLVRDPNHRVHKRLGLYINYARQENRRAG